MIDHRSNTHNLSSCKINVSLLSFTQKTYLSVTVMCFHHQVTDIWYEHLGKLVGQRTKTPAEPSGIGPAFDSGVPTDFDILG